MTNRPEKKEKQEKTLKIEKKKFISLMNWHKFSSGKHFGIDEIENKKYVRIWSRLMFVENKSG